MADHRQIFIITNKKIQLLLKIILIIIFLPLVLKFYFYQLTDISFHLSILTIGLSILFVKSWNKRWLVIGVIIAILYSLIFNLVPSLPCKAVTKSATLRDCDCLGIEKSTDVGFNTSCIGVRRHCYAGPKVSIYFHSTGSSRVEHPENLVECDR